MTISQKADMLYCENLPVQNLEIFRIPFENIVANQEGQLVKPKMSSRFEMLTILLSILFSLMTVSTLFVLFACIGAARASRWEEAAETKQMAQAEYITKNIQPSQDLPEQEIVPSSTPSSTPKYVYKNKTTVMDESDTSLTFNDLLPN